MGAGRNFPKPDPLPRVIAFQYPENRVIYFTNTRHNPEDCPENTSKNYLEMMQTEVPSFMVDGSNERLCHFDAPSF